MTDINATSVATPAPGGGIGISATKVSGPGIRIGGTKNTEAGWVTVRAERDARLAASDWTQMPDSPLDAETKALWSTYRKALRDVTRVGHVGQVAWPTAPAKKAPVTLAASA